MDVFLTGGTGLVGSSVLAALVAEGHTVRALARSDSSAAAVEAAGATAVRGDLTDADLLAREATAAEGIIHTASPGDATSADVDAAFLDAVLGAISGSGKPYVHTGGVWVHGSGTVDEDTPRDAPDLTAWREPLDARVTSGADGVRGVLVEPGIVYAEQDGQVAGITAAVLGGPTDDDGAVQLPGSGAQHWTTVHAADLGRLYVLALTHGAAGSTYLGVNGDNPTVAEIAEAAGVRAVGTTEESTLERLGAFGGALLLDQQATGEKARRELGWSPAEPTLTELLGRLRG
ncbi:NAD-dependent epimerase/dehydratase family protein [Klenkia brasiliensis]|uniref:Nucleoside-diphosphate-sugar epimerase n=1 Tax=Klenkia brasiliensis TaxID=333142 RepID=A0A1G7TDS3_9ACTN|nr:NAD-dependent epimerase/dehydratase family protein [Klenkia brasiliensis]SDG32789.1 Nucleoside-diphosphate-sugar epimerase [Klenkia brasiliensis]